MGLFCGVPCYYFVVEIVAVMVCGERFATPFAANGNGEGADRVEGIESAGKSSFLFNTLNGIYSLSLDKDDRLPQTVLQLSHLMRYFLYESGDDLVPLEKEWQVMEDYIALQEIRSNEKLQLEKGWKERSGISV
ncbi:histidine kinase [Paraflavitalea speifideaquila]|uniref:histidine kinase n=1 Tax=Paraflavitalea speifideaquila TaxID=3076558 RepID=UPI0028E74E1B|nr:histidine kinase [Paraflavitalea speifideiaquila]